MKALYRRGLARNHLGLPEEAIADLAAALETDPANKPVKVTWRSALACSTALHCPSLHFFRLVH